MDYFIGIVQWVNMDSHAKEGFHHEKWGYHGVYTPMYHIFFGNEHPQPLTTTIHLSEEKAPRASTGIKSCFTQDGSKHFEPHNWGVHCWVYPLDPSGSLTVCY